jgi:glutamyl-tRNA reductase
VQTAAQRHAMARRVHEVAPAVVQMRTHVHAVLDREIERARSRGAGAETEAALRHFSGALLHGLISQGHTLAAAGSGTGWTSAVETVFPAAAAAPARDRRGRSQDSDGGRG